MLLCSVAMLCYYVQDVCSLECKAQHLRQLGIPCSEGGGWEGDGGRGEGVRGEGEAGGWRYVEHPEVSSWSEEAVKTLRAEVTTPTGVRGAFEVEGLLRLGGSDICC